MNPILCYIFNHKHYKEVASTYQEIIKNYLPAFEVWQTNSSLELDSSFASKEIVFNHLSEIKIIDRWIKMANNLVNRNRLALEWFFTKDKQLGGVPNFTYAEYQAIATNIGTINGYISYLTTYNSLSSKYDRAIKVLLNSNNTPDYFDRVKFIALSENKIIEIDKVLTSALKIISDYPNAWNYFSQGSDILSLTEERLQDIKRHSFQIKESFVLLLEEKSKIIPFVLGEAQHNFESFDDDTIKKEAFALSYFNDREADAGFGYDFAIKLTDETKLKRAILDSQYYGIKCNFTESFGIPRFYRLRLDFDDIHTAFDAAVDKIDENRNAIKTYNKEHSGNEVVFIENYFQSVSENHPLYKYIETYRTQKETREEAKNLQSQYCKGYDALYPFTNLDTCDFSTVIQVLNSRSAIIEKHNEILKLERLEEQKKCKEKATTIMCLNPDGFSHYFPRINGYCLTDEDCISIINKEYDIKNYQNIKKVLSSSVHNWDRVKGIPLYFFWYYYPVRFTDVSSESEKARRIIWDFKEGISVTPSIHRLVGDKLKASFGENNLSKITFVCIPASTNEANNSRYRAFMVRLTEYTGIRNAFPHISIEKEKIPAHLSESHTTEPAIYKFDESFFKDSFVVLFDDVVTKGRSMDTMKANLEKIGATVIGAISLGRTYSDYFGDNRRPHPFSGVL